ncbi:MAG: TetR/AcrR family transcriptional regulator [Gammaproteobacteria bacterium]|nr:TetR/AcrR family transcriptional regulator [Gammaproteobacteria bacterium]
MPESRRPAARRARRVQPSATSRPAAPPRAVRSAATSRPAAPPRSVRSAATSRPAAAAPRASRPTTASRAAAGRRAPAKAAAAPAPARRPAAGRRWSRDSDGKKRALLAAFDHLLQEQGAYRVGVNAVVKRARVGKALLYHYFGGLDGLAAEWARSQDFLPHDTELIGEDPAAFARLSTREQLVRNYQRYAKALRARPRTLEFLLTELLAESEVLRALENVRTGYGKALSRYFSRPEDYRRDDVVALQVILFAAINYLCLRSRTSPQYFHLRLDRESDWKKIDAMFALIVGRVLHGRGRRADEAPGLPRRRARSAPRI